MQFAELNAVVMQANGRTATVGEWVNAGLQMCAWSNESGVDWLALAHSCAADIMALEANT